MNFRIILLCLFLTSSVLSQELPPIKSFTTEAYNAERQNWSITQTEDKNIYIANNKGLLEFNGSKWKVYNSPNESIMRSVLAVGNKIYTGCYMEFGYWTKNEFGDLNYKSLSRNLSAPMFEGEEIWNILQLEDWVLFQSLDRIYIYDINNDLFNIIYSDSRITKIFKVKNDIYFQRINDGIYKIDKGKDFLILNQPIIKDKIVINMFSIDSGILIQTEKDGIFIYENDEIEEWQVSKYNNLSKYSVYNSLLLRNNNLIIGTISSGVLYIKDGKLVYNVNRNNGLINNTVLSLFEDIDNNIWLGLDNGINCINKDSPFLVYNDEFGALGSVYCSVIYKENLYLGTNQGLFYKNIFHNEKFSFIENTEGQVWCLVKINDELFCGHNSGTYLIEDNQAKRVSDIQGVWDIKQIPNHPNFILQGDYNGLSILENNNKWEFRNRIQNFDMSSRFIEFIDEYRLLVSHEQKGVFNITIDNNYNEIIAIDKENIGIGLNSSLEKFNDEIYYAYREGIFKYSISNNKFLKDEYLSDLYINNGYSSGKLITDKISNKLWLFNDTGINYITPGKLSEKPIIKSISMPSNLRNGITSYESLLNLGQNKYLFGTALGYTIIDLNKIKSLYNKILLDQIYVNKKKNIEDKLIVNKSIIGNFASNTNSIKISYYVSNFSAFNEPEFQYKLEGIYDEWSNWSTKSSELFENLPYGNYTFKVRGKVADQISDNIESYTFNIQRPWYLSNTFLVVYIIGFFILLLLIHHFYKLYYKKQRERLLSKSERELELKDLENKQQSMRFKNERLEQDIENKNRELAISTMSLIKKNEFLGNIKKELNLIERPENLKSVIKMIDRNLNNSDDWKYFEEAFNNADKDFLKKIKTKHNSLTPNDLRLCAYLRLNLSSKEIAPLLNISTRSVEVKRYRLRKKMNLPHESSLTEYILSV